jgi:uncharacterized alpha-E superfamily protein
MFRYLERAENTARLLDAGIRMALTRDMATADDEWRSVIAAAGQQKTYEANHSTYTGPEAWNFILRGKDNPANVREMYGAVRQNARMARNAISGEVWEAVNESWMRIEKILARPIGQGSVSEVVRMIRLAGTLVHGALAGSMLRNEGYHFARAGTFLERADSTARILDIKYYLLLPSLNYVGSSFDNGQWETVLRSVGGDRAFSWLNAGQMDARGIVEFLVLDERFPRSLAFCHGALRDNLFALAQLHGVDASSNQLMREADMALSNVSAEQIFDQGLHDFLVRFEASNAKIGQSISEDYRFLA